jgi:hypothetical protein
VIACLFYTTVSVVCGGSRSKNGYVDSNTAMLTNKTNLKVRIKILFIFSCLLTSIGYAEGPRYRNKEPNVQLEFENVYQDLRNASSSLSPLNISSRTINNFYTTTATIQNINGTSVSGMRNRIVNGSMRIDQRNEGTPTAVASSQVFGPDPEELLNCYRYYQKTFRAGTKPGQGVTSAGTTVVPAFIHGILINGANAGNVNVQFKTETQGNGATILKNSYGETIKSP